jgi:RecB family exonuclease
LPAEDDAPTPTTELAAYWQERHEAALLNADMRALLEDRLRNFQLSPTHVNDFVDVANSGPQAFFLRTILRFPQAPRAQIQYGNAVHETLEWVHTYTKQHSELPSVGMLHKAFAKRMQSKRLSEHDTALYLDRGQQALKAYLEKRGDRFKPDDVVEYNFRSEGVFAGKAHLSGKIDKLIINRAERTIQIVDYKTGKGHSRWTREIKLHKYRQQLYLYKALVEGSHTFGGYTVTDAYLEFVEPDEDGEIQELHVTFDETEFARIKHLAEIVWQHIVNIDLPDVSGYNADLTGVDSFEADLLNDLL